MEGKSLPNQMNKSELIAQTRLAFEFIQKLYFEISYLIKEMEGLLAEEEEEFPEINGIENEKQEEEEEKS